MVAHYVDASALVKRYVREPGSRTVAQSLRGDVLCTSRLSELEVASAVCRREREGLLSPAERQRILTRLTTDLHGLIVVELRERVVERARALLLHHSLGAADAVHLASCLLMREELGLDVSVVAYDRRLRTAATAEGVSVLPREVAP